MPKLVMTERYGVLFPFVRRGLEKYVEGMDVPQLQLQEPLVADPGTLAVLGIRVDSAIARDLLIDLTINDIRLTRGFVQSHLLAEVALTRAIAIPFGQEAKVEMRAKALRDLHVDAALSVLAYRPVQA